jgi:MFS family permease
VTPTVVVVLLIAVTATALLTSEDLGTIAALRHLHHTGSIGWVLAVWGVGSALGGIVYGALRRHPPAAVLLALLAASTAGVAVAHAQPLFTVMLLLSGVFCAPTVTATVDEISRAVPAGARGEAMGWHGSAMTLGGAAGAPFAGAAIDAGGWAHGFAVPGLVGLALALVAVGWRATRPLRRAADGADIAIEVPLVAAVPVGSGGAVHAKPGEDLARGLAPVERVEVQARGAGVE